MLPSETGEINSAYLEVTVSRNSEPVARAAEVVGHRSDEANLTGEARNAKGLESNNIKIKKIINYNLSSALAVARNANL